MKKLLFSVVLFLSLSAMQGQNISTLYQGFFFGLDNIIRFDPGTNFHITCSQQLTGDVGFFYTDMNTITEVLRIPGIAVADFEIFGRYVFFCGNDISNSGVIGWFNIDSLIFNGGTAHVDNTLLALGLRSLDNIEVFSDQGGNIHIAGYGSDLSATSPCTHSNYAFEAVGSPITGMQYRILKLAKDGCMNSIVDMTVTNNYVVYLEEHRSQKCYDNFGIGIALQPFPKYNMFASSPYPYYYFETTTSHIDYAQNSILPTAYVVPDNDDPHTVPPRITHTFDDEVAVCSYRSDFIASSWQGDTTLLCGGSMERNNTYLAFRTYDLSPMQYNNPVPMTAAAIAIVSNLVNCKSIDGFVFDTETEHFVVLHRHETAPFILESAITTLDYSSHTFPTIAPTYYQTAIDTRSQWLPHSLCLTYGNEYTVGGTFSLGNKEFMFWHDLVVDPPIGSCDQLINYMMNPLPTMVAKHLLNIDLPSSWSPLSIWDVSHENPLMEACPILCE